MVSALRECQEPKYKVLFQGVSQALRSCLCPCCSGREAAGNVTSSQPLLLHTSRRESESTTTQTETTLASSNGGASNSSPNECPLTAVDHTWPGNSDETGKILQTLNQLFQNSPKVPKVQRVLLLLFQTSLTNMSLTLLRWRGAGLGPIYCLS